MSIIVSNKMYILAITAAGPRATHRITCATLSDLAAGQAGTSDVVAEFITSTLLIIHANTRLL